MRPSIKIQYDKDEFLEVAKSNCGITNIVIENENDVKQLATTLLVKISAFATYVSSAKINGANIIIELYCKDMHQFTALQVINLQMQGIYESHLRKYFLEEVKKFQNLFPSRK